ncbi:MAG: hypothetical protein ACYCVN_11755 [Acidimicrobiales bacterium]
MLSLSTIGTGAMATRFPVEVGVVLALDSLIGHSGKTNADTLSPAPEDGGNSDPSAHYSGSWVALTDAMARILAIRT